jgi:hypothetical protein
MKTAVRERDRSMILRLFDIRRKTPMVARAGWLLSVIMLSAIPILALAVSKDAQELMALREKRAPWSVN